MGSVINIYVKVRPITGHEDPEGGRVIAVPLPPGKRPGTNCTGGWVGPRAGLDGCGKSRSCRDSIPDRPARSESLYLLRNRGNIYVGLKIKLVSKLLSKVEMSDSTLYFV